MWCSVVKSTKQGFFIECQTHVILIKCITELFHDGSSFFHFFHTQLVYRIRINKILMYKIVAKKLARMERPAVELKANVMALCIVRMDLMR